MAVGDGVSDGTGTGVKVGVSVGGTITVGVGVSVGKGVTVSVGVGTVGVGRLKLSRMLLSTSAFSPMRVNRRVRDTVATVLKRQPGKRQFGEYLAQRILAVANLDNQQALRI